MHQYKITLQIKNHSLKPERIHKYHTCKSLKEAWDFARDECREYNKTHKIHNAVITGVAKH